MIDLFLPRVGLVTGDLSHHLHTISRSVLLAGLLLFLSVQCHAHALGDKRFPHILGLCPFGGLIQPARSESGYRLYSITDLWKLNVIKDMRKMNFSFNSIKDYFSNRTIQSTRTFLIDQIKVIDDDIAKLNLLKEDIRKRLANIDTFAGSRIKPEISIQSFPARKCLDLATMISKPEEIDLGFRKLQQKSQEMLNLVGNKDLCVFMSIDKIEAQQTDFYQAVFCIVEDSASDFDFLLEAGDYLCITYQGPHDLSMDYTQMLLDYARDNQYQILDQPIEVCLLDIHVTSNRNEYVTQIQLHVDRHLPR